MAVLYTGIFDGRNTCEVSNDDKPTACEHRRKRCYAPDDDLWALHLRIPPVVINDTMRPAWSISDEKRAFSVRCWQRVKTCRTGELNGSLPVLLFYLAAYGYGKHSIVTGHRTILALHVDGKSRR